MATIVPPSDSWKYTIGQKSEFIAESIANTTATWSLDSLTNINENDVALIESEGIITIDNITYNSCLVRFKKPGNFYLRFTNNDNVTDTFSTTIYGLNTSWVSKQISLWSNDVGTLCQGIRESLSKINKWSLFKPIRNSEKVLGGNDHWEISDYFRINGSGMKVNKWDGKTSDVPFLIWIEEIQSDDSWDYLYPRGNDYSECFRLNDFQGYCNQNIKSEIQVNQEEDTIYNIGINETTETNKDVYFLEKPNECGILSFSDIVLDKTLTNNLGEYYLMVYVIDSDSEKHFIRILNKLSEQDDNDLSIDIPLIDLYNSSGELYSGTLLERKPSLTRYYFLANNVNISLTNWMEIGNYNEEVITSYPPNSISDSNNFLLYFFRDAIAIPVSSYSRNSKITNSIVITTDISINLKNEYNKSRNISLKVELDSEFPYVFNDELSNSETRELVLEGVTKNGNLIFENCYKTDVLNIDIGNTGINDYSFTPDTDNIITVLFSDIFSEEEEENWHLLTNKITLNKVI